MLFDMMSGKEITKIPYESDYRRFMSRMTTDEINHIETALNDLIDGTEIQTAGWMPGRDWSGTPYEPIYTKAALSNYDLSARCFGLMVWVVFMKRPERWTSGRFEKNGEAIGSRTYFQPRLRQTGG
jgi:hypothetical protein